MVYSIEKFMMHCDLKQLRPKTMAFYEQTLRLFGMYLKNEKGITDANKITEADIKAYIDFLRQRGKYRPIQQIKGNRYSDTANFKETDKPVAITTINNYIRNLKVFFNFLVEERCIKKSPMQRIKQFKNPRKPQEFIEDSKFIELLQALDISKFVEYRDYVIIQLLLDTGMRLGECLSTKIIDVNLKSSAIFLPCDITKGKKDRYVFFSETMQKQLKRWIAYQDRYKETEYLFCTNFGNALGISNFETNFEKYCERINLKNVHPHVLRNNFSKRFLMNGGNILILSRILGHSSVVITERAYLDLDERDLQKQYKQFSPLEQMKRKK